MFGDQSPRDCPRDRHTRRVVRRTPLAPHGVILSQRTVPMSYAHRTHDMSPAIDCSAHNHDGATVIPPNPARPAHHPLFPERLIRIKEVLRYHRSLAQSAVYNSSKSGSFLPPSLSVKGSRAARLGRVTSGRMGTPADRQRVSRSEVSESVPHLNGRARRTRRGAQSLRIADADEGQRLDRVRHTNDRTSRGLLGRSPQEPFSFWSRLPGIVEAHGPQGASASGRKRANTAVLESSNRP